MSSEEENLIRNLRDALAVIERDRETITKLRLEVDCLKRSVYVLPEVTSEEVGRFLFDSAATWAAKQLGEQRPSWVDAGDVEREGMREVASHVARYLGVLVVP